ncbi:three component ABC system middle component [Roseomonas sp. CECT 9278]|uniref:three component ABC system middle component n=1 Tax=Roseomonas sp. CECT 9278 TaxID=2845823 RepID=UPI001E41B65C|nr:three component ABC system middle component [Roseomonas sp. CECT 9278]
MPDSASRSAWERPWRERPGEQAALLNPAFVGETVARVVTGYRRSGERPLPLPLAFLVPPLVLPPAIRALLPKRANATFGTWTAINAPRLVDLPDRILRLRPVTREALLFLAQLGAVTLDGDGIVPGPRPLRLGVSPSKTTDETTHIRRAADLVGRWFGAQADPAAIMQGLGTTP